MAATLLYLLILSASFLGFASLAATQKQHRAKLQKQGATRQAHQLSLRLFGSGLLAFSFILAVIRDGFAFGSVVWVLTITLSAFGVAVLIEWFSNRQQAGRRTSSQEEEVSVASK